MEFEDIQKIWDTQNKEPMYVINETALHKGIRSKSSRANKTANINEIGLMSISTITGLLLLVDAIIDKQGFFSYLVAITLFLTGVYVLIGRKRRKKKELQFDRSMLGELDHAISNVDYMITVSKTFLWWYILPIGITSMINVAQATPFMSWKWMLIPASFVLSFVVVRLGLVYTYLPKKRSLETLKAKLMENVSEDEFK